MATRGRFRWSARPVRERHLRCNCRSPFKLADETGDRFYKFLTNGECSSSFPNESLIYSGQHLVYTWSASNVHGGCVGYKLSRARCNQKPGTDIYEANRKYERQTCYTSRSSVSTILYAN